MIFYKNKMAPTGFEKNLPRNWEFFNSFAFPFTEVENQMKPKASNPN